MTLRACLDYGSQSLEPTLFDKCKRGSRWRKVYLWEYLSIFRFVAVPIFRKKNGNTHTRSTKYGSLKPIKEKESSQYTSNFSHSVGKPLTKFECVECAMLSLWVMGREGHFAVNDP